MASSLIIKSFLLLLALSSSPPYTTASAAAATATTSTLDSHFSSIKSICKSTPYPDVCFDSLKLSISITTPPNIVTYLLQSLQTAFADAANLSNLFSSAGIMEKQRGAIQDCKDLHQITLDSLEKSMSRIKSAPPDSRKMADARAFLTAALTNKNTCLEGLDSASGPMKPTLVNSVINTYKQISNCLSMLPEPASKAGHTNRRLLGFPKWMPWKDRRILQDDSGSGDEYDPSGVLEVAADGSGNFTTVTDAINFAPNNSADRVIIHVREGVYEENVDIPSYKPNIVLLGDGSGVTVITGSRSVADGWTTFRSATVGVYEENIVDIPSYKPNIVLLGDGSDVTVITGSRSVADGWTTFTSATVAVSAEGFLARDITFENRAGPDKHQAVALRVNGDFAAMYRCIINGYQDTLYVHSFRQFYRECDISGTIDFIFGNAAVVFQACNIISRMPLPDQFTVITAQSRDTPYEDSGISIQNCSIVASDDLYSNISSGTIVNSYLGRPWRVYSRTVYIESYIDDFIDPAGWTEWPGDQGLDTLYYGEYENTGPSSATENRVTWPGYHVMTYDDASNFTVSEFITGDEWLDSTSFPYDAGV